MKKSMPARNSIIDLLIIFLTSLIMLAGFLVTMRIMGSSEGSSVSGMDGAGVSGAALLLQVLIGAGTQFGLMGLGITIVCILRGESFRSFGLKRDKLLLTIALSALVYVPTVLYSAFTSGIQSYFPLSAVSFTEPILAAGFPVNIIGLLLVVTAWGFFEGFTYVVIADRINKLLPSRHFFLNWGAILCGILCLAVHAAINLPPETLMDGLCTFLVIYGMLLIRDYTGNAWGTVFIYVFLWNAIR